MPALRHVAPRDLIESQMAILWEQILGVEGLSITTNFFDAGGHSLLAARLLAEVGRTFGKRVALATLLQAPTIESFAARLRKDSSIRPSDQVHEIQGMGSRPPWIILTSQPNLYRMLADHLGPDQPVLGLTSPELTALPENFTVEDVAANLVAALRSALPQGPYYLGGWCVSGVIAYEMARQLHEMGEKVPLITLLDCNCPVYVRGFQTFRAFPIRWYFFLQKLAFHLRLMRQMRCLDRLAHFGRGILRNVRRLWEKILAPFKARRPLSPADSLERFPSCSGWPPHATIRSIPTRQWCSFGVRCQTGPFCDPQLGWAPFARKGLTLYELPGDHDDMFREPVVRHLAKGLTESIGRAVTSAG